VNFLWKVLTKQSIGVLIQPSFPGVTEMGEINIDCALICHGLMIGKLLAIIELMVCRCDLRGLSIVMIASVTLWALLSGDFGDK
jgi:hypothetical protein